MITKNITQTFNWKHREEDFSIINEKAQLVFKIFGIPFFKKKLLILFTKETILWTKICLRNTP